MLERLSEPARQAMLQAEEESRRLGHQHLGTEHLLLGILAARDSAAARVLARSSVTLAACREKVAEAVLSGPAPLVGNDGMVLTARAKRSLERAGRLSLRHQSATVGTVAIMLSVLDVEGTAGQVLRGCAIDIGALRSALANAADDGEAAPPAPSVVPARPSRAPAPEAAEHEVSLPMCPVCKAELGPALAHQVVESRGDDGALRQHVAIYCGACGATLGFSAV